MSVDGKHTPSLVDDTETFGLVSLDTIAEVCKGKTVTKSLFEIENLKKVLEILEKFDVNDIEVILADDAPIIFIPKDRKVGIALAPRMRI